MPKGTCSEAGCELPRHARGFCAKHYALARRLGRFAIPVAHGTVGGYSNSSCRCVECSAAMSAKMRAYNAANPERNRAKARAWEIANPERRAARSRAYREANAEHLQAKARELYLANRAQRIADAAAWAKANPEKVRVSRRAWKQRNPDRVRADVELRRARKAGADTRVISEREWRRLCARHDDRCAYCGEVRTLTQDHVIPIVRGGRHAIGNLLPACQSCNSSKGTKLLVEWRAAC